MDDNPELRERLRLEWKVLVDRLVGAGTPPVAVFETMAAAAAAELAAMIGRDATERYLQVLAGEFKDLTRDETEALIEGDQPEAEDEGLLRGASHSARMSRRPD